MTAKIYYAKTDGETVDDADWQLEAPTFTEDGKYVIWYKVVASNRKDYIDKAKLTIEKFDISSTESNIRVNATTSFKYDGTEHTIDIADVSVQHKGQTDWQPITYDVVGTLSATEIGNYTFTIVCELYAVLKTRHLLDSAFRLVGGAISASDSGLELLKRYFPMFRRYKVVI